MIPIPQKPGRPYAVLFIAEQVMIPKEVICPTCNGEGCSDPNPPIVDCPKCKGTGRVDSETEKVPKQPLTDEDLKELHRKLSTLFGEYGLLPDHYGEKEAMLKRLTTPKPESEYGK